MSKFRIQTRVIGAISTNCYLIYHDETKEAVIVDPADDSAYLAEECKKLGVTPVAILLTHGHFDHMMAANALRETYSCKLYAGKEEKALLEEPEKNLSAKMGRTPCSVTADVWVEDGMELDLLGFSWKVIATPGHTSGSVCYYLEQEEVLISGDTLFAESFGRTDLPTGNTFAIIKSVTAKLFALPDAVMVYPGHGDPTTIGHEKKYNPLAKQRRR